MFVQKGVKRIQSEKETNGVKREEKQPGRSDRMRRHFPGAKVVEEKVKEATQENTSDKDGQADLGDRPATETVVFVHLLHRTSISLSEMKRVPRGRVGKVQERAVDVERAKLCGRRKLDRNFTLHVRVQ